jgi:hypothetical protein
MRAQSAHLSVGTGGIIELKMELLWYRGRGAAAAPSAPPHAMSHTSWPSQRQTEQATDCCCTILRF